jgi:hypothetical protein
MPASNFQQASRFPSISFFAFSAQYCGLHNLLHLLPEKFQPFPALCFSLPHNQALFGI